MVPIPAVLYKIGGAVVLLALVSWKMHSMGAASVQGEWDAQKAADLAAAAIIKDRSRAVTESIDKKHQEELSKVRTVFKTIIKEVPVYVDKTADDACVVPLGFVLVHDFAASGEIPKPPSSTDGLPSGVEISAVAETVAENYGTYAEIRQQLIDLQEWVKRQAEVTNK